MPAFAGMTGFRPFLVRAQTACHELARLGPKIQAAIQLRCVVVVVGDFESQGRRARTSAMIDGSFDRVTGAAAAAKLGSDVELVKQGKAAIEFETETPAQEAVTNQRAGFDQHQGAAQFGMVDQGVEVLRTASRCGIDVFVRVQRRDLFRERSHVPVLRRADQKIVRHAQKTRR